MGATKERGSKRAYWERMLRGVEGKDRSKARQKPKRKGKKHKKPCAWCKGEGEYTIIDDDFGQPLRPSMIHYCFNCGRKLKEEDDGKNH